MKSIIIQYQGSEGQISEMSGNLDNSGLEKMMDNLAGQVYDLPAKKRNRRNTLVCKKKFKKYSGKSKSKTKRYC